GGTNHGDFSTVKPRPAHVGAHGDHSVVLNVQLHLVRSGECTDDKFALIRETALIDIFRKTADTVAAGLGFAAIRVENTHFEIVGCTRLDEDDAIRAGAEVVVAPLPGELGPVDFGVMIRLDKMVVISETMQFGKVDAHESLSFHFGLNDAQRDAV